MKKGKEQMIEFAEEYIVLTLPVNTVEVTIQAKVMYKGKLCKAEKTLDAKAVRAAFNEAENGYIPSDAMFTLTDKGRQLVEDLERERNELGKQ